MSNAGANEDVIEIWAYRSDVSPVRAEALAGYGVEARDGSIGKIDEATDEVGACYLIVDTGPWIFGKKVMLPAGVVTRIDSEDEIVHVDLSREAIKHAPPFNQDRGLPDGYREALAAHYTSTGHEAARAQDRLRKTG